jgi:signal peptidase I
MAQKPHDNKIVIYFNAADIFLGLALVVLVSFFIYNYLQFNYFPRPASIPSVGMMPGPLNYPQ